MAVQPDQFRQKTLSGLAWKTGARVAALVLQLVISVILARLLSPEEFGLIGMIVIFTGFAAVFVDMGFGAALVQKQDAEAVHYDSVFWVNAAMGLLLTALFVVGAPLIGAFYGEPLLLPLTTLLASNFFLGSLGVVQAARLRKALDFRSLAVVDLLALVLSGAVGVSMALMGWGVWSLAVQSVLASALTAGLLWVVSDWAPRLRLQWDAVRGLLGFSGHLLGFSALNYWFRNADNLLIGRVLGETALGVYAYAYRIMLLPVRNIASTIGSVMFPAFSAIQQDRPRVARLYLRTTRVIALVTFPMMLGLIIVAEPFVLGMLGAEWRAMVPVLQLLCVVGAVQSILTFNGNLYQSQGRTDLQLKVGGTTGVLGVAAIVMGLPYGVVGVALCYASYVMLSAYPVLHFPVALVGLHVRDVARNLAGVAGCTLLMAGVVWGVGQLLPPEWPHSLHLLIMVAAGVALYIGGLHAFNVAAYRDARTLLKEQWQRRIGSSTSERKRRA